MGVVETIALTLGIGWASGINLYAAVFMLGYLGNTGHLALPPDLAIVADPMVMAAAGLMYMVEFFADKTPGVDTAWDAIHAFIRIPAGAVLAAGAAGELAPAAELAGFLIGGTLAAGSYSAKAGGRVIINTSPEPFSNWVASIGEDLSVIGGLWLALYNPWLFLVLLVLFIILLAWLLPKLWRGLRKIFYAIGRFFGRKPPDHAQSPPESQLRPDELDARLPDPSALNKPDPGKKDQPP